MPKLSFGQNLRMLRCRIGLTQYQVAEILKISHQSVSKWENDLAYPSIDYCLPIITIYQCTLNDLFQITD